VRFLSSRRRHPAAKFLLLVAGLFVMGASWAVLAPSQKVSADTNTTQQIAEGKALFRVGCASCHGMNGEGQISEHIQGPSLVGTGAAAVEFQVSTGRMPMSRPDEQAPAKPNRYTEEEVLALAAFVQSLAPGPEIPTEDQVNPGNLSAEDLARGGELFRTTHPDFNGFSLMFIKGGDAMVGAYSGAQAFVRDGLTMTLPKSDPALARLAGRYVNDSPWWGAVSVVERGGALWLGTETPLVRVSDNLWRVGEETWTPERASFGDFLNGRPQTFIFSGERFARHDI